MEAANSISNLKNEILLLKRRLDSMVDVCTIDSENVIELSQQLDVLIVGYYNLKKGDNAKR